MEMELSICLLSFDLRILFYYLNFARVGAFHMQGISGRSYSELCFALNNAADGSLRLPRYLQGEN